MVTIDQITEKVKERFWTKVEKTEGCWLWKGRLLPGKWPYGELKIGEGQQRAHRVSWMIHFGEIPDRLLVCHHCDNPSCVRPDHLFIGTQADNMQDSIRKGKFFSEERMRVMADPVICKKKASFGDHNGSRTHPERLRRGESQPSSVLTEKDIRAIRSMYIRRVFGYHRIAKVMGVSKTLIRSVLAGKTWRHVQ